MTENYKIDNIEVYGFMGNLGEGKNYVAEELFLPAIQLIDNKPYIVMAFADHFKINAIAFNNLEYDKVFIKKDTDTRKKLQEIGTLGRSLRARTRTEFGCDKYGEDIWIRIVYNWMKVYASRGIRRFIITDVRFENEVNFIKQLNGIIIRVYAPDRNLIKLKQESDNNQDIMNKLQNHPSEIYVKNFKNYKYFIDNRLNPCINIDIQIDILVKLEKLKN